MSMSLDGFIAPESLEDLMGQQWMELQQWIFPQRYFRENLKLGEGGEAAGDRDVRIAGGGATILEYLNAGLVDEFSIALSPVLFGSGIRLFEGVDAHRVALEPVLAEASPRVTHLAYAVRERSGPGGTER